MSLPESEAPLLDLSNLKFQPAWVNESSDFSNYAGSTSFEERRSRDERDDRRPRRPGGPRPSNRDRRDSGPRPRDDARGSSRRDGQRRPQRDHDARKNSGPRGATRDHRRSGGPARPPREEAPPVPVKVEFLPDEAVVAAL